MSRSTQPISLWLQQGISGWNRFWFAPRSAETLAIIRLFTGLMLAYVHLVWLMRSADFFGESAWITGQAVEQLHGGDWAWSWLWYTDNMWFIGLHQVVLIAASLCMAAGFKTRVAIPIAWLLNLMVCHRLTLSLFGLDQILVMLSMYLMVSDCGAAWSVDARGDKRTKAPESKGAIANNIATRLIQLHLCVIYLFGGLSKMRGEMWFDGSALWFALANYEYQSLDLTVLGKSPLIIATLTAATIFWETFYCALVWPRWSRPLTLGMAVLVHGGIALALGMITFGWIMIVANFAFVEPETTRRILSRVWPKTADRAA